MTRVLALNNLGLQSELVLFLIVLHIFFHIHGPVWITTIQDWKTDQIIPTCRKSRLKGYRLRLTGTTEPYVIFITLFTVAGGLYVLVWREAAIQQLYYGYFAFFYKP